MRKLLTRAGLGLALTLFFTSSATQEALVYRPVPIDHTGCDAIVDALTAGGAYASVDRGYDGNNGTVDLRAVDLLQYSVVVVPSLADDVSTKPYAFLRDSLVSDHLKAALIGGLAVWSGAPD